MQAAGGLGALLIVYPLWNDLFGISTYLKNATGFVLTCGFIASALCVVLVTYLSLVSLPRRLACSLGLLCWVLTIIAGYQVSMELAKSIK